MNTIPERAQSIEPAAEVGPAAPEVPRVIHLQPIGRSAAERLVRSPVVAEVPVAATSLTQEIGSNIRHFVSGVHRRGSGGPKPFQMQRRGLV